MPFTVEDMQKSQELVTDLADYIDSQTKILRALNKSLSAYVAFLQTRLEELRDD